MILHAARGGRRWGGVRLGDLVPAALTMGFVVGIDAVLSVALSVADAAELAGPGVTKIAVLHCLKP